jgi:hypothetical protein
MTVNIEIPDDVLAELMPDDLRRNEIESDLDWTIRKYGESQSWWEERITATIKKELIARCHTRKRYADPED